MDNLHLLDKLVRAFFHAKQLFILYVHHLLQSCAFIYIRVALFSYDGTSDLATVESYDPITNSWQPEVSMGTRRSCLGVAVLHGLLYAAGGYDGASCLNRYAQPVIMLMITDHFKLN